MRRFKLVKTGTEYNLGDTLVFQYANTCKGEKCTLVKTLTENEACNLMALGVLEEIEPKKCEKLQMTPSELSMNVWEYIENDYMDQTVNELADYDPFLAFKLVLKIAAIIIDAKYKEHITDNDTLYFYDIASRAAHKASEFDIKFYKSLALFRTKEECELAVKALEEMENDAWEYLTKR